MKPLHKFTAGFSELYAAAQGSGFGRLYLAWCAPRLADCYWGRRIVDILTTTQRKEPT